MGDSMSDRIWSAPGSHARQTLSGWILGTGFSLTGTGTVMLGVLLPIFSERWGLHDDTAGLLLFLQFLGSAMGAVLTSSNRVRSLIIGYGLLVAATCALAFAGSRVPFAVFFFYGLGLGMVMTATSLIVSDRAGDNRAAKLEGLNFVWSVGAMAGPMLLLPFVRSTDVRDLFVVLLGLFLLLLVWVVLMERREPAPAQVSQQARTAPASFRFFLPFVLLAMGTVGVEAALSGWLTTYSHRAGLRSLAGAALATSLFWLGGMISRLAFSTRLLAAIGRRATLQAGIWGVVVSVAALVLWPNPAVILSVAGLAGLSLGPLYPLVLSYMLERSARGWIFAVGGIGAAVLPWITGLLSSHFNSLRYGLIAPCAVGLLMAALQVVALREPSSSQDAAPARL